MSFTPEDYEGLMKKSIGKTVDECSCGTKIGHFEKGNDIVYGRELKCPKCEKEYVNIKSMGFDFGIVTKERYKQLACSTPEHMGNVFDDIEDECLTCFTSL